MCEGGGEGEGEGGGKGEIEGEGEPIGNLAALACPWRRLDRRVVDWRAIASGGSRDRPVIKVARRAEHAQLGGLLACVHVHVHVHVHVDVHVDVHVHVHVDGRASRLAHGG